MFIFLLNMAVWGLLGVGCFFVGLLIVKWVLRNVNGWYYERNLGERKYELPPGDLGWPFIGNMWSFLRAFKCSRPESFISTFVDRSLSLSLHLLVCSSNELSMLFKCLLHLTKVI